jgi:hypothetical protein
MHVHLVFVAKYWRKVFDGDAIERLRGMCGRVCANFEAVLVDMDGEDDHVHLLVEDDIAAIRECGFELVGHFTLPDEAWWDDFYTPMENRIAELRGKYAGDVDASAILDQLAEEPEMHRRHSDFYAYEFFVAHRSFEQSHPEMSDSLEQGVPADRLTPAVAPGGSASQY